MRVAWHVHHHQLAAVLSCACICICSHTQTALKQQPHMARTADVRIAGDK